MSQLPEAFHTAMTFNFHGAAQIDWISVARMNRAKRLPSIDAKWRREMDQEKMHH